METYGNGGLIFCLFAFISEVDLKDVPEMANHSPDCALFPDSE